MRISDWSSDVCSSDLWFDDESGEGLEEEIPPGKGQPESQEELYDPRYDDLENRYKVLEQILLKQRDIDLQSAESKELDTALEALKNAHPEYYDDDIEDDVVRRM